MIATAGFAGGLNDKQVNFRLARYPTAIRKQCRYGFTSFDLNRPSAIRTHQAEWIKHCYQDYPVAYDRVVTDRRER
jgi:hypothetical protein